MRKFPVTTEDGREFRVTISCDDESMWGHLARVNLYVERKGRRIFRFKRVYTQNYARDDGYDWKKPDFIALTARTIADYDEAIVYAEEIRVVVAQRNRDIDAAHTAFHEWDGRLSDGSC